MPRRHRDRDIDWPEPADDPPIEPVHPDRTPDDDEEAQQ